MKPSQENCSYGDDADVTVDDICNLLCLYYPADAHSAIV